MKSNRNILIKYGLVIKDLRKNKGLSQEELAHKAGFHRTYIGMIERAERNITLANIEKLANALEISISELTNNLQ
jgi:transcriptional regulator with XRE-family HTH domain